MARSTRGGSSAFNAVVDVSVLVPVCFENPLRADALSFVAEALSLRRRAAIPTSAFLGAYHVATSYLGVPRAAAKAILAELLETKSPALYEDIPVSLALEALDYAALYGVESWDGYLVALALKLGAAIVYSLDKELSKVQVVEVVSPFPEEKVRAYHEYLRGVLSGRRPRRAQRSE